MKTLHKHIFPVFLTLLFLVSCEKEISFHRNDIPDQLQMNGLLAVGDTVHYVHLAVSRAMLVEKITDGSVRCLVNGRQVAEGTAITYDAASDEREEDMIIYNPSGTPAKRMRQTTFAFRADFAPGDVVRIEAEANGGRYKAWSEVTVPDAPEIALKDTSSTFNRGYYLKQNMKLRLRGKDSAGERNLYRIDGVRRNVTTTFHSRDAQWDSTDPDNVTWIEHTRVEKHSDKMWIDLGTDPILTEGMTVDELDLLGTSTNTYCVYSDHLFDGNDYDISFSVEWYNAPPSVGLFEKWRMESELAVRVMGITAAEYAYLKALDLYQNLGDDTVFAEPASFPDNVEGGLGFIGIANPITITIPLPPDEHEESGDEGIYY